MALTRSIRSQEGDFTSGKRILEETVMKEWDQTDTLVKDFFHDAADQQNAQQATRQVRKGQQYLIEDVNYRPSLRTRLV